jgi:hypothetical protein
MENTYWNRSGTYQNLAEELGKLVPAMGEIKGSKNRQLERYRKAQNAYYDIFNNGGCNRGRSIGKFFEGVMFYIDHYRRCNFGNVNWQRIHAITEPKMDEIILAAAAEQKII